MLWCLACMVVAFIVAKKNKYPTSEYLPASELIKYFVDAIPSILLIVIIIGGILSGCLFMLVYGLLVQRFAGIDVEFPIMALYGLLGSAVTEIGDLSFSLLKRQYGVTDYGTLLPGHGGMLDRFDSTTFAAPVLLLLVEVLPAF